MGTAYTLEHILDNDIVSAALDRTQPITKAYQQVMMHFRSDIDKRNPRPAYIISSSGELIDKNTDMDLFTFLNELSYRKAVVNIPEYERISPRVLKNDEIIVSDQNRHGELIGVIGNKEALSFSMRIIDYNIIKKMKNGKERVGMPRNFSVVGYDGEVNPGWKDFFCNFTEREENFIKEKFLSKDGFSVCFGSFVHPNKAFSFYGAPYLCAKILSKRVEDEARHYRQIANELFERGVRLRLDDFTLEPKDFEEQYFYKPAKKKKIVENLEVLIKTPEFKGNYPILGLWKKDVCVLFDKIPYSCPEELLAVYRYAQNRARELSYSIGPRLTAVIRSIELAFFKYGFYGRKREPGNEIRPGWDIPEWDRNWKEKGKNTKWNVLHFNNVVFGYRFVKKSVLAPL